MTAAACNGRTEGERSLSGVDYVELVRAVTERGMPLQMKVLGSSMTPSIRDGDLVTIVPLGGREPRIGEVLAFVLPGQQKLIIHRAVAREGEGWLVRGDNGSVSDGVVIAQSILGSVTQVRRNGRPVDFGSGLKGAGIARLSRSGVLILLQGARRLVRRPPAYLLLRAQSYASYRAVARRFAPHFRIEAATGADTQALRRLISPCCLGIVAALPNDAAVKNWVARRGQRVAGVAEFAEIEDPDSPWNGCWIHSLAVKARYRGLGLGEALAARVLEEAAARGARGLSAVVCQDNEAAVKLLQKLGFFPTSVERLEQGLAAQWRLSGERYVVMTRELPGVRP